MIKPTTYKLTCTKCNYTKTVKPKSDIADPKDLNNICPKCGNDMERKELNGIDKLLGSIFGK